MASKHHTSRRLLPLLLLSAALLMCAAFLAPQWISMQGFKSVSFFDSVGTYRSSEQTALDALQFQLGQCVDTNGLGLRSKIEGSCKIVLEYPEGTNSSWYNQQFKIFEPLEYEFDICETLLLWEQYRNMTTILTREYLDARPNGWPDYAALRISQLGSKKCDNISLCEELLELVLPPRPPFRPSQFATCAVVGNSGDLLKTQFGEEIDSHDVVIRDNEAPVNKKYAKHVGLKRNFRLIARGVARNILKVAEGSADEVLIIKSLIHKDFNQMIKELPNPTYLFQGVVFRRGAKGTGVKSLELALSMCDSVDMYGFTVDPGYTEWTRYFSTPRKGHNPLQGRAYYQLLECLGFIRIHSPMRESNKQNWSVVPNKAMIHAALAVARKLKRAPSDHPESVGPFHACKIWASASEKRGPLSGSKNMSELRKSSNYSKWEKLNIRDLRHEAQEQYKTLKGVRLYKIDGNKLEDLLCIKPLEKQEF